MVELWDHQKVAGARLLDGSLSALLWAPRCGKTLTAIHGSRDGDRLIVCPSSVKPVWRNDLRLYGETDIFVHGLDKKPTHRPKNVVVNYESLWRTNYLECGYDTIIFDESHRLANFRTKLFEKCFEYIPEISSGRVILLTGTPCAEGYHQLIAQSIIATGQYDGHTDPWEALRAGWVYDETCYKWKPLPGTERRAKEILHRLGMPMTQEEAGISTRKLRRIIDIPLTKQEEALWENWLQEHEGAEGPLLGMAAQSVASGRDPETGHTKSSSKLDAVVEFAVESGEPFVIFGQFTSSLDYMVTRLRGKGIKTALLAGGDGGDKHRAEVLQGFGTKYRGIVAQVSVAKVGLNLAAAGNLIFAENSYSGEARIQAEERATVRGKSSVGIVDFCAESSLDIIGEIDMRVRESVIGKKDFNAAALRLKRQK